MPYRYIVRPGGQRARERVPEPADVSGTAADVLAAVGNDADRARAALDAERASDKPRSTLMAKLEGIANG